MKRSKHMFHDQKERESIAENEKENRDYNLRQLEKWNTLMNK